MSKRIAFLLIALIFGSCHKKKLPSPIHSFPVQITTAQKKDVPIFIEALGHIESMTSVDLFSRIKGELTGVYFKQGEDVRKGDLLFTIDPKPYQAELKEAQALLEQSMANLSISEEKVKRYRTLTKNEYYSQIDYETLQSTMAANKAQVLENEAQVEKAKINLDYCWIYAPHDGMMGILNIDFGNLINPTNTKPLATLNQMDPIYITFSIPEYQLPRIQKAMRAQTEPLKIHSTFDSFENDELFEGHLDIVNNEVSTTSGMMKFRGLFSNTKRNLWPGQFIRNRLIISIMKDAVVIPFEAVQITQTKPIVFVVRDDMTVEQRTVKLGQRENESVIVLQGLEHSEKIVTEGQINLFSGASIFLSKSIR